jgi:hypothetical protein
LNIYAQITISDWFFKPDRSWTAIYKLIEYNGEYYWEQSAFTLEDPVVTTLTKTCKDILTWSRPGTQFLFEEGDLGHNS